MIAWMVILSIAANALRIMQMPGEILGRYGNLLARLPEWLGKPLGGCSKCFAGQLALWSWFYFRYHWFEHILFVLGSVTLTYFIELIILHYERT